MGCDLRSANMRLTLVLTTIIFTALLTYAKLLAIGEAPPRVYNAPTVLHFNGSQQTLNSSPPPMIQSN
jgi:hypothetical protein